GGLAGQLLRGAVGLCGLTALLNLNPLLRLDGYWLLCDGLELPNLRRRSFACLRDRLAAILRRRSRREAPLEARIPAREQAVYLVYAAAATVYTALLVGGLAFGAARWIGHFAHG